MPEVVVATPDADGKPRNWDQVFPIWKVDAEDSEWRFINTILESLAMNQRVYGLSMDELRAKLLDNFNSNFDEMLEKNREALAALPNVKGNDCATCERREYMHLSAEEAEKRISESGGHPLMGYATDHEFVNPLSNEHQKLLKERESLMRQYGIYRYYLDKVIENYAGGYREYRS